MMALDSIQHFGIPAILVGILLLFFGRKLFWLLVAILGFYAGVMLSVQYLHLGNDWHSLLVGAACGLLGIFLVTALQKITLAVFGLLAGIFLVATLAPEYGLDVHWWWYLVAGILGAFIAAKLFQIALVVLSALLGAQMTLREIRPDDPPGSILFFVLAGAGMIVQFAMMKRKRDGKKGADAGREDETKE